MLSPIPPSLNVSAAAVGGSTSNNTNVSSANRRSSNITGNCTAVVNNTLTRRKSLLSYHQHQQHMTHSDLLSPARYNPHQHEHYMQQQQASSTAHVKLSLPTTQGICGSELDESNSSSCCLPPPSPAPNNDHYIGMKPATSGNHYSCQQQQQHQNYGSIASTLTTAASNSAYSTYSKYSTNGGCNSPANESSNSASSSTQGGVGMQRALSPSARFHIGSLSTAASAVQAAVTEHLHRNEMLLPLSSSQSKGSGNVLVAAVNADSGTATHASTPTGGPAVAGGGRFHISSAHFLTHHNMPLLACGNVGVAGEAGGNVAGGAVASSYATYISATVHTPVKRYVPTPPLSSSEGNGYACDGIGSPLLPLTDNSSGNGKCLNAGLSTGSTPQHASGGTYRYRMKCCMNEQQQQQQQLYEQQQQQRANIMNDFYPASPRTMRDGGSSATIYGNNANKCKEYTPAASAGAPSNSVVYEYQLSRTPSVEYINAQMLVADGLPAVESVGQSSSSSGSAISTNSSNMVAALPCLHCNTVRRTTGVHQTTQTTGPISPIPVTLAAAPVSLHCSGNATGGRAAEASHMLTTLLTSTSLTPSTSESHISPLSPMLVAGVTATQQHKQQQQKRQQQQLKNLEQKEQAETTVALYHSRQQQHMLYTATAAKKLQQQQKQQQQHLQVASGNIKCSHSVASSAALPHVRPNVSGATVQQQHQQQQQQQQQQQHQQQHMTRYSRKKRFSVYLRKELACFFGVEVSTELDDYNLWHGRQRRLALRRFGTLKADGIENSQLRQSLASNPSNTGGLIRLPDDIVSINDRALVDTTVGPVNNRNLHHYQYYHHTQSERPDILPAQDADAELGDDDGIISAKAIDVPGHGRPLQSAVSDIAAETALHHSQNQQHAYLRSSDFQLGDLVERKASVAHMLLASCKFVLQTLRHNQTPRNTPQWSRSFAPTYINNNAGNNGTAGGGVEAQDIYEGMQALQDDEVFFDAPSVMDHTGNATPSVGVTAKVSPNGTCSSGGGAYRTFTTPVNGMSGNSGRQTSNAIEQQQQRQQMYISDRVNCGWRTRAPYVTAPGATSTAAVPPIAEHIFGGGGSSQQQQPGMSGGGSSNSSSGSGNCTTTIRGTRISTNLLDGVLENSRRPLSCRVALYGVHDLDERTDHRPFFTYWINTVQTLVLFLSLICYGIGPIGFGAEQRTGQVLVTSLSLQTVQHTEHRNLWIGPRNTDLVHMGAKFSTCMRRDVRIIDVLLKTRRQERETACCIRNDDSGCVQSSQADCSVRGLFPTKSISTWKKWSPGESGPGGRISGSVCGLDPKYCDAPASIAPYEWPDDITKWPICRKANSFAQRFRYKDHTAEHMACEVIGHPCCTDVHGECRITTHEYCDFVNGYYHEEASLCSQISCLNNVCGMFPFLSMEMPDQFYRLFTSLYLHAGILHLAITVAFQHIYLADLERLIGPIRTAIMYIGCGIAGNLTSAVLVPYKPEVGPLASISGVVASLVVLLVVMHWKNLHKPHVALFKLIVIGTLLFGLGTLPWQMNFLGLLAGVLCGVFLTVSLVPFVSIGKYRRKTKINTIWFCTLFHIFVYTVMLVIFYVFPTELTNLNLGEVLSNTFNTNVVAVSGSDSVTPAFTSTGGGIDSSTNALDVITGHVKHHLSISESVGRDTGGVDQIGNLPDSVDSGVGERVLDAINHVVSNRQKYIASMQQTQPQQPHQQYFYYKHHYSNDIIGTNDMAAGEIDATKIAVST